MAQRLYEAGYITYMRTDSTHLSNDSIAMCRNYIDKSFGDKYLTEKPMFYSSKEGAQEAHEAIRPTEVKMVAEKLMGMEPDAVRLYTLIWQYFVACQMQPARYLSSSITVSAAEFELRTKGRIMQFDGYLRVMPSKDEDVVLPAVEEGDSLDLELLEPFPEFHQAASSLHRSQLSERVREARHWPSFYLCFYHLDDSRSWLCSNREQALSMP